MSAAVSPTRQAAAADRVPDWLLPAELVDSQRPRRRRTARDWLVDAAMFLFAVLWWAWGYGDYVAAPDQEYLDLVSGWMLSVDPWVGAAACLALWWRRRFPLAIAIAMVPVLAVAATSTGAAVVSIFTVAVHRGWLAASLVTAVQLAQAVTFSFLYQPAGLPAAIFSSYVIAMFVAPLGWGLMVRMHRQLVLSLRRDATRQRQEQQRRLTEARRAERARIAREMHDVLAHRISLLSVHAGALAYRSAQAEAGAGQPLVTSELADAVRVIRDNAHEALADLGQVLAVLRAGEPDAGANGAPLPQLADLPRLVEEAHAAGQDVTLRVDERLSSGQGLRAQEQRTVYRVVQEGLTNARKHAPGAPVTVRVAATPGEQVRVEVSNPVSPGPAGAAIPGAGAGLAGLAERVGLDGGQLRHEVVDGSFRLAAQLPWQA